MKLHLPVRLFKSVLACLSAIASLTMSSGVAWADAQDLTLDASSSLAVDYADSSSIIDLEGGILTLKGDSALQLSGCGEGDGKTYILFTGISALKDAAGNAINLDSSNNAIANYFDTTLPGSGFWADATLQMTADGTLQLVRYTDITLPTGYGATVTVDDVSDISTYSSSATDVIFRVDSSNLTNHCLTIDGRSSALMSSSADSRYFTSADVNSLSSLTFSNATKCLFNVESGEKLEFAYMKSVTFSGNMASTSSSAYGGAIYAGYQGSVELSGNGAVTFSGNKASSSSSSADGGAIYAYGTVTLSGNGAVTFSGNTASSEDGSAYGGAIDAGYNGTVTLSGNGAVTFSGNTASDGRYGYGGAIYVGDYGTVMLSGNGNVIFSGNTAFSSGSSVSSYGGAISTKYIGTVTLSGNGNVIFSGNTAFSSGHGASVYGGAIYTAPGGTVTVSRNGNVLFEKNAEVLNGSYRLRSIYTNADLNLSASEGKKIEFRDSIYASGTVNLNADYTDDEGVTHRQTGDIIFTGATTEVDLLAVKGCAGTEQELINSRMSIVKSLTNLFGGRLRIEDGAIYQGQGITAVAASGAIVRVKDATLDHNGYDLTFNATATFEISGKNTIFADNIDMHEGSNLHFNAQEGVGLASVVADLAIQGAVTFSLSQDSDWSCENGRLLYVFGDITGWDTNKVNMTGAGIYDVSDLSWVDGVLVLNYNAATYERYFNDTLTLPSRQIGNRFYHHYEMIKAENISSSDDGGAIDVGAVGSVTLSKNGAVTFSGNTASGSSAANGGAIYGATGSVINITENGAVTFSDNKASGSIYADGGAINTTGGTVAVIGNGEVMFRGNEAFVSGEDSHAQGGAIDAGSIMLNGNGNVTFSGNIVSGSYARGGAIYTYYDGTITVSGNGNVLFEKNAEEMNGTYRIASK